MASEEPVHPLRLSKNSTMSSPTKKASAVPRPLSEISPTEKRRNSPSWKSQSNQKMGLNTDSSPFQSSPLDGATSPRLYWQKKGLETDSPFGVRSGSPSPTRRSSIERLQKASRVKNSSILALEQKQEYDPTRVPHVERPLAKVQGNAFGGTGVRSPEGRGLGHQRSESKTGVPLYNPALPPPASNQMRPQTPQSPSREQGSPMKSSLTSRFKSSFDPETGIWSADSSTYDGRELPDGKELHRHTKSVTFDAAPPQVNEYEMATPDISSIGSNSRDSSYDSTEEDEYEDDNHYRAHDVDDIEDSFDASLEDTDKTPVVGPDDWKQLGHRASYEKSPHPDDVPAGVHPQHQRTDSSNSNGDHRPLPPLPGAGLVRSHSTSSNGLSATAERMLGAHRSLPSPPPASASKSEIQNIGNGKMTLEERLKLMMLSDDSKSAAEQQRERRMRRAGNRGGMDSHMPDYEAQSPGVQSPEAEARHDEYEEEDTIGELSGLEEYQLPPRISRESILRRVNGNKTMDQESEYNFSSPAGGSPDRNLAYDRDIPIPSTEDSMLDEEDEDDSASVIMRGDDEADVDLPPSHDMYHTSPEVHEDMHHESEEQHDSASHYSDNDLDKSMSAGLDEEEQSTTPRAFTPVEEVPQSHDSFGPSAQAESTAAGHKDLLFGLESVKLPRPDQMEHTEEIEDSKTPVSSYFGERPKTPEQSKKKRLSKPEYDGTGWGGLDDEFEETEEEPGTPESVIHTPMPDYDEDEDEEEEDDFLDVPAVPDQVATIKSASGSKLKTRPSATPSDLLAMREARRQVSREVPAIPTIPERHRNRLSRDMESADPSHEDFLERHPSFKNRSLTLDLDLGLSLDQDFDRVIEAQKVAFSTFVTQSTDSGNSQTSRPGQAPGDASTAIADASSSSFTSKTLEANITTRKQRGYLMRQNTKVVTASDKEAEDRICRSAGNSPIKQSRPQSWTVEPWNGNTRRKSIKKHRPVTAGAVPPLPGQESNSTALNALAEEELTVDMATEESGERGRLFVKVMGVKDLDLPMAKNERTWFSLTLDNGVHCVTTAWLELARNAPIGQEFELVVPNELEFQLTLNVKLEKPAPQRVVNSPTKVNKPKTSTFSRVFASPKKRKEMELRAREEEERFAREQREQARQLNKQPTAWDLLSPLTAEDGSFARAYVCLKEHEAKCFGRPYLAEVATFNEWATEEAGFASSVKSKRGNTQVVRRAPYKIGKLELQLLFVPRPKGATDDDMPKSMNSCIREMKAAEERLARNYEGHLSQQGGDCPYWRRRYFKLVGTKLTAYHEATRQPRATINLANSKRLIDDRRALTEKETTGKHGKRRRSAFAEEEEGYMFVEEGFRIRFNNGEVIDFYADSTGDKEGWMKVLSEVIGRDSIGGDDDPVASARSKSKWCELVIKREEAIRRRAEGRRTHSRTRSMYN